MGYSAQRVAPPATSPKGLLAFVMGSPFLAGIRHAWDSAVWRPSARGRSVPASSDGPSGRRQSQQTADCRFVDPVATHELLYDPAGIALVGACLMVACGALTLDEAYRAVDLDALTLLLGMMI
jgi:di/tricarboxylate transporter